MILPKVVGRFKMLTSKNINEARNTQGIRLWQRNYYEHIIRNEKDLSRIREYTKNNPKRWSEDKFHVQ